jgi:hypothetical protein
LPGPTLRRRTCRRGRGATASRGSWRAARDAEAAELVKLRFFAGLTSAQAAAALGISPRSADCAWTYARVFLLAELNKSRE